MKTKLFVFLAPAIFGAFSFVLPVAMAQGTAFTYQGRLNNASGPATGSYDLAFTLYTTNSTGSPMAGPVTNSATAVTNGLFTTMVDFGAGVFTGGNNWLQIAVRTNGTGSFTPLSPRQQITPTPYALTAGSVSGVPAGMALIPAGMFAMGDSMDGETDAIPVTNIMVSAFYMDVNLVSLSQWQVVYFWATNNGYGFVDPGLGRAANQPVQTVDWFDCVKWCNARSQQAGRTPVYYTDMAMTQVYTNGEPATIYPNWPANGYRLPTEAEWEKAARGGLSGQRFPWGNQISENLANYFGFTGKYFYDVGPNGYNAAFTNGVTPYTSPVGYFAPNGYGLYDMAGNVFDWCWDWYGISYGQPTNINPTGAGPASGLRVLRGGSWIYDGADYCRSACRQNDDPTDAYYLIGFRSAMSAGQ